MQPIRIFACLIASVLAASTAKASPEVVSLRPSPAPDSRPLPELLPPPGPLDVQLVIDDGILDTSVGVSEGGAARQFLWFNRFTAPAEGFQLEQVWVLFPNEPTISAGASIELVVFHDPDGDPTNGADHLASVAEAVQVADGTTFSIYAPAPPIPVPAGGDVLIGVVNRFVTSGVSPVSQPAALDVTATQGRSWIAIWSGDPPVPPALPSDGTLTVIDTFPGLEGNWLIRGLGTLTPPAAEPAEIPVLGPPGLLVLTVALLLLALLRLRSGRPKAEVAS